MRTKLTQRSVRNPVTTVRSGDIKAKFDDLDNTLDAIGSATYAAAGAISPNIGVAFLDATAVGMAMTLGDGAVAGETIHIILAAKTVTGTAVLTPANLTTDTTLTFDAVGERVTLIWTGAAWTARAGGTATAA